VPQKSQTAVSCEAKVENDILKINRAEGYTVVITDYSLVQASWVALKINLARVSRIEMRTR
jgi:hypothetical protein